MRDISYQKGMVGSLLEELIYLTIRALTYSER